MVAFLLTWGEAAFPSQLFLCGTLLEKCCFSSAHHSARKKILFFFSQIHELAEFFYLYLLFFSSSINYFNSPSRQIFNLSHFFLSIHNKPSGTRGKTQLKHSTCERKKNTKRPKVHLGMTIPACHVPDVRRFDCLTLSSSKLHLRPMMPVTSVT